MNIYEEGEGGGGGRGGVEKFSRMNRFVSLEGGEEKSRHVRDTENTEG